MKHPQLPGASTTRRLCFGALPLLLVVIAALILTIGPASAQTPEPTPTAAAAVEPAAQDDIPLVHIVQEGETLYIIAQQYETTVEVLQQLNDISDPSLVFVGQELTIPGGGGELAAAIHIVQLGDTLAGLAAGYDTTIEAVAAQNHMVSPNGLVAGLPLAVMSRTGSVAARPVAGIPHLVREGDTLLAIAAAHNLTPAEVATANDLAYPIYLYPGQRLRIPGRETYQYLDGAWGQVRLFPAPMIQGQTAALFVAGLVEGQPVGQIGEQPLRFSPIGQGYLAFIALDAFTDPGRYRLEISGLGDQPFVQEVLVESGGYGVQLITVPDALSALLAPEIRANDEAILATAYEQFSEPAAWQGPFQEPIRDSPITAGYGDARSYNQGPIEIFHTGVDYAGPVGTPIYAPAAGTVVFSGTLNIQGDTLIIDHGLGVMTGYYHLSKIHAAMGETVTSGQLVAEGGSTGLSSGPHLHWDLRVGNVPVNGLQWTTVDLITEVLPDTAEDGSSPE